MHTRDGFHSHDVVYRKYNAKNISCLPMHVHIHGLTAWLYMAWFTCLPFPACFDVVHSLCQIFDSPRAMCESMIHIHSTSDDYDDDAGAVERTHSYFHFLGCDQRANIFHSMNESMLDG